MKIDETRNEFTRRVSSFIRKAQAGDAQGQVLLAAMYTGSGKTTGVRDLLESMEPTFIYLAPRHDVITDNFWKKGSAYPHLKARSRFLDKEKREPYCLLAKHDPKIADLLRAGKIDVSTRCRGCDYFPKCDYWKTRQVVELTNTSWMGVHAHIPTYLTAHFKERPASTYDLIIIDENPFMGMFEEEVISHPGALESIRRIIVYNELENAGFMEEAIKGLEMMLVNGPSDKYLERAMELAKKEDTRSFISDYNDSVVDADRLPFKNIPPYSLVKLITGIFNKSDSLDSLSKRLRVDTYRGRKVRLMDYHGDSLRDIGVPMIILDATASVSIWETLLGKSHYMVPPIIDKWRHRHVTHFVGGGEFYKTTWEKKLQGDCSIGIKVLKRLCMISPSGVLMTGHKAILDKILKRLESEGITNARAIWHYGLTSDNNFWENCDTIVVTSKPMIPPIAKEMYSGLTGLVPGQLDYIFTESEIMQAIGRVRQPLTQTSSKLPGGTLTGQKTRRDRKKVQILVFPELQKDNPFSDPDSFSTHHYNRISPHAYYEEILGRGYVSVIECKTDVMKKIMKKSTGKSEIRTQYPFRDFDVIFGYLLGIGKIEKHGGEYRWIDES